MPSARHQRRDRSEISADFKAFIAGLPCLLCEKYGLIQKTRTQVCHIGDRGLMQRSSDFLTAPFCEGHHLTFPDAHHRLGRNFWSHHGIDRDQTIRRFNEMFDAGIEIEVCF